MNDKTHDPKKSSAAGAEPPGSAGAEPGPMSQTKEGQPANGETMSTSEQISLLKQERDELKDQAQRAWAEFSNYQKRAKQQADADRAYAVGSLAKDLLDPLDNLDRAIDALRAKGAEGITAGLDMVQRQLHEIMSRHGVEPIVAQGRPFDPNLHEAILQQPSLDHPEGTVVAEMSRGYTIRDRVLRPSKVAVSVRPAAAKGE
jgi:molecular chaperone GrpE